MKLVIFGLSVSSSWGNGHATLWRGLCREFAARGHEIVFFERDAPWYAASRDTREPEGIRLVLYPDWPSTAETAQREAAEADAVVVTSYCPDALQAKSLAARARRAVFYDLDTPVTLDHLRRGQRPPWLDADGLAPYDLVLSYTGGAALTALRDELGAHRVAPLYGSVDPAVHHRTMPQPQYVADLSYIGTFAADRQAMLERLLVEPARRRPERSFVIAGAQYPENFPWTRNIRFVRHLPPAEHAAFYSSGRLTLNVTRAVMARMGWCPSGRLFEAAACGAAILSDDFEGLGTFFGPGAEILIAGDTAASLEALDLDDARLAAIGAAARRRVLAGHTAAHRAAELETLIEEVPAASRKPETTLMEQR